MLTKEQFSQLRKQGLSVEQIIAFENGKIPEKKEQQEGFISKIFRAATEPAATLAVRPIQAFRAIQGKTPEKQAVNLPYYGKITAPTTGKDLLKDVGRAAETVALGLGTEGLAAGKTIFGKQVASAVPKILQTPGLKGTVQTGLKGLVKEGAKAGFKTGAVSGGLMSFGDALQEAEVQPAKIAYKTLFGAATGGSTGGIIGGFIPVVVKGAGGIKKYSNIESLNKELENLNNRILRPTPSVSKKWTEQKVNPIKTYTEIFGKDIPAVNKDNRFIKESVEEFVDKVNQVYRPAAEGFNTILRNSPEVNSLSKMESEALKRISESNLVASQKTQATSKIKNEFLALREELGNKILGDDNIPVALTDILKDRYWGATRYFGPEEANVSNETNRAIARTFAKNIEDSITDVGVKNYNKGLQELIVLRDYLSGLENKLSGSGGKMTRLMSRVVGSVVGAKGGPVGSAVGSLTGDKLAQIWINPAYSPQRWLIMKQLGKLPQAERITLERQANDVIQQMIQKRMQTLALPPPSGEALGAAINAGRAIPVMSPRTSKEILGTSEIIAGGKYVPPKSTKMTIPVKQK